MQKVLSKKKQYNHKKLIKIVIIMIISFYYIMFPYYKNIFKDITQKYINNYFKRRIFICTLYNNEAEMAYIHLWRLYDYIDHFIIVTSNITHSGNPKLISFKNFDSDIKKYMDKVDLVNFNNICNRKEYPHKSLSWCIENSQRDYAKDFIEKKYNPTDKDLLIVVDIDEILTREGIIYIKQNPPINIYYIRGAYYFPYYYHRKGDWDRGYVIRYNKNMSTLSNYRTLQKKTDPVIKFKYNPNKPLITHCSYCFRTIDEYKNKIISFAHKEYNIKPYNTSDWIFKSHYCRQVFKDDKGYDEPYEGWKHLIPNDERLKYLIDRTFMYPLNQTTYNIKDLESLCTKKYNRTPFE